MDGPRLDARAAAHGPRSGPARRRVAAGAGGRAHARRAAGAAAGPASSARPPARSLRWARWTSRSTATTSPPSPPIPSCRARTSPARSTAGACCWWTTCSTRAARCAPRSTSWWTSGGPRASSWRCWWTAATASCPSAPTTWASRWRPPRDQIVQVQLREEDGERPRAAGGTRGAEGARAPAGQGRAQEGGAPAVSYPHRHLLGIEPLEPEHIHTILDTAEGLREVLDRPIKKVPTLRGKTVVNLFYEASTRTRASFEVAREGAVGRQPRRSPPPPPACRRARRCSTPRATWRP